MKIEARLVVDLDPDMPCAPRPHYVRNEQARPVAFVPALRPKADRFEELLVWAGQRAAANGIVLPYLQEGFTPTPLWPAKGEREAAPSAAEPPDELELPPLQGGMDDASGASTSHDGPFPVAAHEPGDGESGEDDVRVHVTAPGEK